MLRRRRYHPVLHGVTWFIATACAFAAALHAATPTPLSPVAIVATHDGAELFIACATANAVLEVDERGSVLRRIEMPAAPSGLALSPDGTRLAVTCAAPTSTVCLVDVTTAQVIARFEAGHTTLAPVFSNDGTTLYVCNRFHHEIEAFDVMEKKMITRLKAEREPVAATLTPNGKLLFVANHLPKPTGYGQNVAASVTVIDASALQARKTLRLPNGSGLVLGVAVSPDGRHAAVTHNLARYTLPTTQVERGWMNTAALTLIDVGQLEIINTVLLDNVELGAANPWAVAWTADGRRLLVTHAGTHELSVIDFPALLARLERLPANLESGEKPDPAKASNVIADVPSDLAFLVGVRQRVKLHGNGPRSLAVVGGRVWVANYFSDSIDVIDLDAPGLKACSYTLGPSAPMSAARRGERAFNDATLCFQQWQSCASCHSYDARVDGFNWDLLNDGIGNPKNAKSLLWSHRTPPAMSTGVRDNAEVAVRAGIRHILFTELPADVPTAIDEYLKSLSPAPSPFLENGKLSRSAQRGKALFESSSVSCANCHSSKLFTNLQSYDVGTAGPTDPSTGVYDTPTLVELWRTAPYLHDGSARTIREVLTRRNANDQHGKTSQLNETQIDDLANYVLSL